MEQHNLQELFVDNLKDLYSAEKQILKALPKLIKGAKNEDLASALEEHRGVTEQHVARLERIFKDFGKTPRAKHCKGMEGLLEEGSEVLEEFEASDVRDAGMIVAAQKVEHYEIAAYGSLRTFAEVLGQDDAVALIEQTLEEEKEADQKLSELAEASIDADAAAGEEEERPAPRRRSAGR